MKIYFFSTQRWRFMKDFVSSFVNSVRLLGNDVPEGTLVLTSDGAPEKGFLTDAGTTLKNAGPVSTFLKRRFSESTDTVTIRSRGFKIPQGISLVLLTAGSKVDLADARVVFSFDNKDDALRLAQERGFKGDGVFSTMDLGDRPSREVTDRGWVCHYVTSFYDGKAAHQNNRRAFPSFEEIRERLGDPEPSAKRAKRG
jgi:hypothetical protein